MSRKPTDTVQVGLRIRESLRRQLEKESEKHRCSINQEMAMRLEDSFRADALRSIDASASYLANHVARLDAREHEANKLGDLLNATEALLKQIDTRKPVEAAATKVKAVIEMINTERARAVRRARTTGEGEQ
jgi:hypothetical protein